MEQSKVLPGLFLWVLAISWLGFAQDQTPTVKEEIIVKSSKAELTKENLGQRVLVITAAEIETHQWRTVADVMSYLPSISMVRNGGDGTLTTAFVRGANSENTLILLNGIKLNDASSPSRRFDFGHFSTQGIERIEYLPGPQNTLYGSDASSGVINIITRQDSGSLQWHAGLEGGSGDSTLLQAGVSGSAGALGYNLQLEHRSSEAISAGFDPGSGANPEERDGYKNSNGHLNLTYRRASWEAGLDASLLDGDLDLDKFPFNLDTFTQDFADDDNLTSSYRQEIYRLFLNSTHRDGLWRQSLILGRSETSRRDRDLADAFTPFPGESRFDAAIDQVEWRHNLNWDGPLKLTVGTEYEREKSEDQGQDADTTSLFGQLYYQGPSGFSTNLGLRGDSHSDFGDKLTYRFSPVYRVTSSGTRLFGSFGTGFKAPSLFQLHADFFGNPELNEEESESWEAGIDQELLGGKLRLSVNYYHSEYESLIDFVFNPNSGSFAYANQPEAETQGMEWMAELHWHGLNLRLSYDNLFLARTRSSREATWSDFVRRADDKIGLLADYRFEEGYLLNLEVLRYGESSDFNFFNSPANIETLADYLLVNLGVSVELGKSLTLSVRGENLLDETYTQVIGYQVHGARGFLGLRYRP